MSGTDSGLHAATGEPHTGRSGKFLQLNFWLKELPFSLVLVLTLIGVAYTSFSKRPIAGYWEILTPLIALLSVSSAWHGASDNAARIRLIGKQVLHWLAFLLVMNLVLLSTVQKIFTANTSGLTIFTLLALGTFTSGVQVLSWQVCLLGLIMALGIPAIAWIEKSALLILLVIGVIVGIAAVFWWYWREWRKRQA